MNYLEILFKRCYYFLSIFYIYYNIIIFLYIVLLKETTKLQNRSGTVTPPPSPTSGQTVATARTILDVEGLATGTSEVCIATLDVLAHLFSWIELSEHISTNLLDAIFTCARYHDAMVGFYIKYINYYILSAMIIISIIYVIDRMVNKLKWQYKP